MSHLLVTGGSGFIGSHSLLLLLQAGFIVTVVDDLSNSSPEVFSRLFDLTGMKLNASRLRFVRCDIRDTVSLSNVFANANSSLEPIVGVLHFAGLKSVSDSVSNPLLYWDVNVSGSSSLLSVMSSFDCRTLVFSSTCTVYGNPDVFPLHENSSLVPVHPYAQTKLAVEHMLSSLTSTGNWRIAILRYFNPVGAHFSGLIGESPQGVPNNLFPYITQVASGVLKKLSIFGNDYSTPDGTAIRDYVHVMDLAEAHLLSTNFLLDSPEPVKLLLNLGSGRGLSVFEVLKGFETATGISIPYEIVNRRPGDVPKLEASCDLAYNILGWKAQRSINDICVDGWAWQSANPYGYQGAS